MTISQIIAKEVANSKGEIQIKELPDSYKPTEESLKILEKEIGSRISENNTMRNLSLRNYLL